MKIIIKIAFVAIIACFAIKGIAVLAHSNGDRTEMMLQKIQEKLELSDEQVNQIKPILENFKEQMHALISDENVEDKRAAKKELMEAQKEKLSKILSEEQMGQLHEIMKRGRRGHHRGGHHAFKHERNEDLHKALKEYFSKNIMPVVKVQRSELDKNISSTDKDRIDEIRAELKELHPKGKDGQRGHQRGGDCDKERDGKSCDKDREGDRGNHYGDRGDHNEGDRGDRHLGERGDRDGRCGEGSENREAVKSLMKEVKTLGVKYESEIKNSLEPLGAKKENWIKDISQIIKENISEEEAERVEHIQERVTGKMLRKIAGKRYLLLDPNGKEDVEGVDVQVRNLNVFPNPAKGFNTFEFDVLESGNVEIGIYNQQGKFIKTVMNEYKEAGKHSVEVSLEGLNEDVYFYQIVDQKGDDSERFMVK